MPDYDVAIDRANINTSHVQVLELVGPGKRVLDVGCWRGELGRALMDQGCKVSGVEIDPDAAATAAKLFEKVAVVDLDRDSLGDHFEQGSFDVVVFADVLEHLLHPAEVLRSALPLLAPSGEVVISLPNVAHGSLRLAHLQGRWDLTDTGLLDRTHIRFFNREGFLDLLEESGLVLEELRGTIADPLGSEVEVGDDLPAHVVEWVRDQPDAFVYQFEARARVRRGNEPIGRWVPLQEVVPVHAVRIRDQHTHRFEDAGRAEFRARDEIRGLQAETVKLRANLKRARERQADLRARLENRNGVIDRLQAQLEQMARRPAARVRRKVGAVARRLRG
ncbi:MULTISPECIES: class I SAM-dependent methyltransferase [Nocardioides]|uniref:Class I SAM-dependent methyltransferase n=1 Tax=Nocardioides vastitatis TaxID=2568655 RepID=A0ABW0ZGX3_9ACTN|nr:class I SAM-dependent methyltransferase [Nocardioides sp.]THI93753.1 class I SAM-dependent methyltransferase [Nocardioides sp.]